MAESPSGSLHRYFKHPGEIKIKNSASELAPGVDTRGDGGMVVAPPTRRADGQYRWLNDLAFADPPPWLLAALAVQQPRRPRVGGHYNGVAPERWERYATSPPTEIGVGTIFWLADKADHNWRHSAYASTSKNFNDFITCVIAGAKNA
jgi:hypothetical protein